jgi:ferredoxin-nitrite reductase
MSILSPPVAGCRPAPASPSAQGCPGLFCPTPAQDGILSRVRTTGGQLSAGQAQLMADLVEQSGSDAPILITNRANLQLRLAAALTPEQQRRLQLQGLAGPIPAVDHLRNIMVSPTAGIDAQALLDTRPLLQALDAYIAHSAHLAALSAKFSIGIDGGESVSIRHRRNDIWLVAEPSDAAAEPFIAEHSVGLRLFLGISSSEDIDTGIVVHPDRAVALIAAIADLYLDLAPRWVAQPLSDPRKRSPQPRLRDVINHGGIDGWIERLGHFDGTGTAESGLEPWVRPAPNPSQLQPVASRPIHHLGIHPQRQAGLAYVGIVVPLGQLSSGLLRALAQLATTHGSGSLRLTPWQTALIPDVPIARTADLERALAALGCSIDGTHPAAGIVACAGRSGCAAAATETQNPAKALIQQLIGQLDAPINIHISGCSKACAQPYAGDIALLGVLMDAAGEGYEIYLPAGSQPFGQRLHGAMPVAQAIDQVAHLIRIYQFHRYSPDESFCQFTQRQPLSTLQTLFAVPAT